jgi:DNA-binding MarR family transcriptional regulator
VATRARADDRQPAALPRRAPGRGPLAAALKCDNSNVTGVVDRLEAAGLVERRPAAHDRRVKTVVVTALGTRLRDEADRRMRVPPPAFARLGADDARALREILERLAG